jgi:hypothetical protein
MSVKGTSLVFPLITEVISGVSVVEGVSYHERLCKKKGEKRKKNTFCHIKPVAVDNLTVSTAEVT